MADEKKLTNEQLDEVAGGMGNVTQAAAAVGQQVAVDQSVSVDQTVIHDESVNPWVDDITLVKGQYHEGDNVQQNVQQNNGVPGDMLV